MLNLVKAKRAIDGSIRYEYATILTQYPKVEKARVKYISGSYATVHLNEIQMLKKKSRNYIAISTSLTDELYGSVPKKAKHYKTGAEVSKPTLQRLGRYRSLINIVPVRFHPLTKMGNFKEMLADDEIRQSSICMFNDNHMQWQFASLNPHTPQEAGGGNAIARPWEVLHCSIGMPTGPYKSLDQEIYVQFANTTMKELHTVKEIIDEAINRIARLFLSHPEKNTLYFSVNSDDPPDSTLIGLGIFAGIVGTDVREYISLKLQQIPSIVQISRQKGVHP
jgi:hypothetical protein